VKPTLLLGLCLLACTPAAARAQTFPDEADAAKFQFGPLGLTPKIALKNVGFDTNPLNSAGDTQRDFTATLVPGVDTTLRAGRGLFIGKTSVEWNYFNESSAQRSFNFAQEGRVGVAFYHVMPYVGGSYVRTRQRPTLEIDERVQQFATMANVGAALRVGPRLRFEAEARRSEIEFGRGTYGDAAITYALDGRTDLGSVSTRYAVTPLTTLVVRGDVQHDRFDFSQLRNSNSVTVVSGLELKPSALISGRGTIGFRRFDAIDSQVPDYAGLVAQLDAKYIFREATQFTFVADRNVEYSVEFVQPYYVVTGGTVSLMQMVGGRWFTAARIGQSRLAYRDVVAADIAAASLGRTDRVTTYGVGAGRFLGQDLRVGVDVDHVRRTSVVALREYEGFRVGGSISYGY
jgi:hypothetical protein